MKTSKRKIVSLVLTSLTSVLLFTGCGNTPEKDVINCEKSSVTLGASTFYMRYYEALAEHACNGDQEKIRELWNTPKEGDLTHEQLVKSDCIRDLSELCLIKANKEKLGIKLTDKEKKAIDKNVEAFTKVNSSENLDKLGIRKEDIRELTTLLTYKLEAYKILGNQKVREIPDAEAQQGRALYVRFPLDEGDPDTLTNLAEEFADSAKNCKTPENFRNLAKSRHLPCETTPFDRTTAIPSRQMIAKLFRSTPETSTDLIKDEDALYVAFYVTDFDAQATVLNRDKIRQKLQKEHIAEALRALEAQTPVTVDTEVLEAIDFTDNSVLLKLPSQE